MNPTVAGTPADEPPGRVPDTNPIRTYVRWYLQAPFLADEARRRHAETMMWAGKLEVDGGSTSEIDRQLRDSLTGEPVAWGHDGPFSVASAMLHMFDADNLYACVPIPGPPPLPIPGTLRRALEEWVCDPLTADEDVAAVAGWPVETVREHR